MDVDEPSQLEQGALTLLLACSTWRSLYLTPGKPSPTFGCSWTLQTVTDCATFIHIQSRGYSEFIRRQGNSRKVVQRWNGHYLFVFLVVQDCYWRYRLDQIRYVLASPSKTEWKIELRMAQEYVSLHRSTTHEAGPSLLYCLAPCWTPQRSLQQDNSQLCSNALETLASKVRVRITLLWTSRSPLSITESLNPQRT
jgi:hypothetical protein